MARCWVLAPHLHNGVMLKAAAAAGHVPYRAAQRWLAAYRRGRLAALGQTPRRDKGRRIPAPGGLRPLRDAGAAEA
ncbi:hypothetical protein ACIRP2_38865 [Streptomyces sp. NPDC101194]|uniref:hypothetical protein n=1 Tax=Streptomyces sp. NPDC101194 TaxID=3366127 RepID=UPI0038191972